MGSLPCWPRRVLVAEQGMVFKVLIQQGIQFHSFWKAESVKVGNARSTWVVATVYFQKNLTLLCLKYT